MTMTNYDRRKAAARLRENAGLTSRLPNEYSIEAKSALVLSKLLDCIGSSGDVFDVLADLIDCPTCRNVSGHRDEFECSECRCKVESLTEVRNERGEIFRVPFMPEYCPGCSAEVVEDD